MTISSIWSSVNSCTFHALLQIVFSLYNHKYESRLHAAYCFSISYEGRQEMFYSTHFIYGYMASDKGKMTIQIARERERERERTVLFNDALNTFYLRLYGVRHGRERNVLFNHALNTFYLMLYGVRHMVKDHSDSEKGNPLLSINSKGSFICTIPQTG